MFEKITALKDRLEDLYYCGTCRTAFDLSHSRSYPVDPVIGQLKPGMK
jgi:hypothetical protein